MKNTILNENINFDTWYEIASLAVYNSDEYLKQMKKIDNLIDEAEKKTGIDLINLTEEINYLCAIGTKKSFGIGIRYGKVFTSVEFAETMDEVYKVRCKKESEGCQDV